MYEFIKGKIAEINPTYVVLETSGVGYILHISLYTYTKIKENDNVTLFTHFQVREDAHVLYGFADVEERELFRQLITVSGVGTNTARLILSSSSPAEVTQAIVQGNIPFLQSIKGIGVKTAERIIVDLKGKLPKDLVIYEKVDAGYNTKREEALSGLVILGFSKMVAEKALNKIIEKEGTSLPVEQLIRHALKIL